MKSKKYTIAHLISSNFFGGPEKQIVEHLKILNKGESTGIAISFQENGTENEFLYKARENGILTEEIVSRNPVDIKALKELIRTLKNKKIDLLCSHGYKSCVLGLIAARFSSAKCIAFSRGYTSESFKVKIYEWLERQALKSMDGVVSVSFGQEKRLNSFGVYPKRSWVVHNAVYTSEISDSITEDRAKSIYTDFGIPEKARFIVAAGRLSPEKGQRFLIEAAAILKDEIDNLYFIFCGEGECKEELINLAKQKKVNDICRFPGFRKDITEVFRLMDFLVLPSLTEGLPNVILEAFSLAKSVVSTDVGGVSELVTHNKNGLLVQPGESKQLARAIKKMYSENSESKEMGACGYHTVRNYFSFDKQNLEIENIYNELIER